MYEWIDSSCLRGMGGYLKSAHEPTTQRSFREQHHEVGMRWDKTVVNQ